jgi:hypothetical protein
MRKLHPSYEAFVKEQKPKYGKTFLEWYVSNHKVGDIDLLTELQKKNTCFVEGDFVGYPGFEEHAITYFKDYFPKKLQICQSLIANMANGICVNYELDIVADIMDLYEDVIQEICISDNVYVTYLPSGIYGKRTFQTQPFNFKDMDEFKEELSTGIVILYNFHIKEDFSINARYFKWEPLTRRVLVERIQQ